MNSALKIGLFNQDLFSTISKDKVFSSIIEESIFDRSSTMQLLGDLHLINVSNYHVDQLSGGQLVCYNLVKLLVGDYDLILLDEPTNFLDISSVKALEEFIINYPFAAVVVSHDQEFIKNLNLDSWKIENKHLIDTKYIVKSEELNQS